MIQVEDTEIVDYIIKNNANVRETAKHFGMSRQTVSNRIARSKNKKAQEIMEKHLKHRSKYKYLEKEK